MKEIALQKVREAEHHKLNILREYLQNYILFLMQKVGMTPYLYFVGGTALRFLYRIRRYSEDLDFSRGDDWAPTDFPGYMKRIAQQLEKAGYSSTFKLKEDKVVQKAAIGFTGLLYESGLSHRPHQKLSIHIEIDVNPPTGWHGEKTVVDLHLPVLIQHYDLPSMFAGKLDAVFTRRYTKGRDIYDLFWYLSKWKGLIPNFNQLNNAVRQKIRDFPDIDRNNWLKMLEEKIQSLKWAEVKNDVIPFLESRDDLLTFTKSNLLLLLRS